ncbi:methyl-accepting chemotaxis protein [Rhodopseudomonas palustris]|uniref:Methyl-accepting chemotaxis protein n=1 Tax=Thiospirillum jenense TaxID=1653858 RepID=A0A839H4L1_9GAMM|nr:PAS domain-containing methyl-accepting chemotaxis protein [Thiospirillum jenense]MBB1089671.1 methyl-accepting chemotaxis protein [Rhodopseudomonas palustris]MBB1124771.1 methyl-accepting chemotaxis protein [Thiospirillum jenense]
MKINLPVTGKENDYPASHILVSVTDTKGIITYCNRAFVAVSGFDETTLLGASHNIVRHPDMPAAAFKQLWDTVKSGKSWRGIVKNRCQNGDHYWVDAYVTPVYDGDTLTGYQSVRVKPTRLQIQEADALYAKVRARQLTELPQSWWPDIGYQTQLMMSFMLTGIGAVAAGWLNNIWIGVATLAFGLTIAYWLANTLLQPVQTIMIAAKKIAGGDLTYAISINQTNEVGAILQAIKMLQARLATVIGHLQESMSLLTNATREMTEATTATHQLMGQQHHETDMVAMAMNEVSITVTDVARNTVAAADAAHQASIEAHAGHQLAHHTMSVIDQLAMIVTEATAAIENLGENANHIGSIVGVIHEIADQTNLLALNAAIEAARAGEQGRGFAVVADEVRALAKRTQESTQTIQDMIHCLQNGVQSAVTIMGRGRQQVINSVNAVRQTGDALSAIVNAVMLINDMNTQIATAAEQQSAVGEEMNRNVVSIRDLAEQTLMSADRVVAACDHLDDLAQRLNKMVNQYRI